MDQVNKDVSPEWAVIYSDQSVFSNLDGTWEEAPGFGIQAIVYKSKETGWSIATDGHYYTRLSDGSFLPLGFDALMDYVVNVWGVAKIGRMISRDEYGVAMGKANELMRDVVKTGSFKSERTE